MRRRHGSEAGAVPSGLAPVARENPRSRKHTPAEVLIRKDRDRGHRDDF